MGLYCFCCRGINNTLECTVYGRKPQHCGTSVITSINTVLYRYRYRVPALNFLAPYSRHTASRTANGCSGSKSITGAVPAVTAIAHEHDKYYNTRPDDTKGFIIYKRPERLARWFFNNNAPQQHDYRYLSPPLL